MDSKLTERLVSDPGSITELDTMILFRAMAKTKMRTRLKIQIL